MAKLHQTVYSFISLIDALPSRDTRPAQWGAREVLSHLVFWHEHYVRLLRAQLEGREPRLPVARFKELNAFAVETFRREPIDTIAARFAAAQRQLERLSEDERTTRIRIRIKAGSMAWPWPEFVRRVEGHVRNHASWVRAHHARRGLRPWKSRSQESA